MISVVEISLEEGDDLKVRIVHKHLDVALLSISQVRPFFEHLKRVTEVLGEVNEADKLSMSHVVLSISAIVVEFLNLETFF